MKTNQLTFAALAVAIVAAVAWTLSSPATAQGQGAAQAQGAAGAPVKIATANPSKIFFSMKEKTDVQATLQEERKKLGFGPIHADGWREEPRYDKSNHHVVWALVVRGEDGSSVNLNTRQSGSVRIEVSC